MPGYSDVGNTPINMLIRWAGDDGCMVVAHYGHRCAMVRRSTYKRIIKNSNKMKVSLISSISDGDWAVLVLPEIIISKEKNKVSVLIGWICFATLFEFGSKEMKKV